MTNGALYSPYGAYELKAKYQKNFAMATMITTGIVFFILLTSWLVQTILYSGDENIPTVVIKTIADLGPPPSIAKKPPQVKVQAPDVALPKVGIPKPVADEEILDENVVIASRDELADIQAPDPSSLMGDGDIVIDIDDYLPSPDDFIAREVEPEPIKQVKPPYPRMAKQAGITGTVWVKSLVDEDGEVLDVIVYKSSGTQMLDDAAVDAAKQFKFKPAIQNGRPVKVWVAMPFEFTLNN